MPQPVTVLFTIDNNNECRIGLPPLSPDDNYHKRAQSLGKLENVSHVLFNPKGQMFAVRGDQLFRGPTPNRHWDDWFKSAKCVGRGIWDQCKFLFFSPAGNLYVVTKSGAFYKGPEPENENVPWIYKMAAKLGDSKWQALQSMFFDPLGSLHSVFFGELRRTPSLCKLEGNYMEQSIVIGEKDWEKLNHFISFSSDGKLWCVSRDNGNMYTGDPPTADNCTVSWVDRAANMKSDYRIYKHLAFTEDKTIMKILQLDFLTDVGKVLSMQPEVVTEKVYDNRDSTSPLKCIFEVDKIYIAESSFNHEHAMDIGFEAETSFKSDIPFVGESEVKLTLKTNISNKLSFTETNRTETHFKMTSEFELEPGKCVRQTAVAKKANLDVPYTAEVLTQFGSKTTICGTWEGVSYFNLCVKQSDVKE